MPEPGLDSAPPLGPPAVRLGELSDDGIAASIYALVDRGVSLRPELLREMRGALELRFDEDLAAVQLGFEPSGVWVADGDAAAPDVVISGRLAHIVALTAAPLLAGVPSPLHRRGRVALAHLARGRVQVRGDRVLGRRFLELVAL